ncbi:MAG TPA: cytochrome c biogenesis protein ResB [Candidatus Baltobacteraceae bacterium]|nr:cytochrome c biogenesis protein ResB [Candidatus Baltobacteraceae bacterium]
MEALRRTTVVSLKELFKDLVHEFLVLFANVLFAVSLFAVWAVFTLIGVIVDQNKGADFYWQNYTPALARIVLRLHLDNIYHSPAYIGIIVLILMSMAVATFRRVIPARLPALRPVKIDKIPLHASVAVEGDEEDVRARVQRFFAARGWQIRKREFGGEEWSFVDKHNWARRGVLVAHVGFVIIAAGTTIYWATGYLGQFTVLSGTTGTIPQTGATVELERFGYRIDPVVTKSGIVYQPIDYVSHVLVTGKDGIARPAVIRVNQPYDVDGVRIYQATYGFGITFALTKDGRKVAGPPATPLMEGETFSIPGTSRAIQYRSFVGTIDRRTGQAGRDPRPNDPGVELEAFDGDQAIGSVLVPLGKALNLGAGYALTPQKYTLYSGFQYRYDPGIPLVLVGAIVLVLGLCISFYLLPARLYVVVTGAERSWNVGIAATTVKGYDIFEDRFRDIVEALRRTPQAS